MKPLLIAFGSLELAAVLSVGLAGSAVRPPERYTLTLRRTSTQYPAGRAVSTIENVALPAGIRLPQPQSDCRAAIRAEPVGVGAVLGTQVQLFRYEAPDELVEVALAPSLGCAVLASRTVHRSETGTVRQITSSEAVRIVAAR